MEWSEVEGRPLVAQSGNNTDGFNVINSQSTLHLKQDKEKHLGKTNSFRFIIQSFFSAVSITKKNLFILCVIIQVGHLYLRLLFRSFVHVPVKFQSKTLLNFQIKDRQILSK